MRDTQENTAGPPSNEIHWPADRVERWDIGRLRARPDNPMDHPPEQVAQIAASMRTWGWTNPVLVDEEGEIIAGHGRVLAALSLGYLEVPVMVATGWSDDQKRAYVIADNKIAQNGDWDKTKLRSELDALGVRGFDLELVGFNQDELRALKIGPPAAPVESPLVKVPDHPVTIRGDVWIIGAHRVVCGDATDPSDWARAAEPGDHLVFTSPPYGLGKATLKGHRAPGSAGPTGSVYQGDDDDAGQWPELMARWTPIALRWASITATNVQLLAGNKRECVRWITQFAEHLADIVTWKKGAGPPQMLANVFNNDFEWVVILNREAPANRVMALSRFHATESNVVSIPGQRDNEFLDIHRATMPVELAVWAVEVLGPRADRIIDPFCGTGTTLVAAHSCGKPSSGIELQPGYVDVIVERLQRYAEQPATLEGTGDTFEAVKRARA